MTNTSTIFFYKILSEPKTSSSRTEKKTCPYCKKCWYISHASKYTKVKKGEKKKRKKALFKLIYFIATNRVIARPLSNKKMSITLAMCFVLKMFTVTWIKCFELTCRSLDTQQWHSGQIHLYRDRGVVCLDFNRLDVKCTTCWATLRRQ